MSLRLAPLALIFSWRVPSQERALSRGAFHVLCLLLPYLDEDQREHLHSLAARYTTKTGGD